MGPIYVDAETREEIHIRHTGTDNNGRFLEFDNLIPPGIPGPPSHAHPKQTEHFEVLEGNLRIFTEGKQFDLVPGETATVAPLVFHTFENPGHARLVMRVRLSPALDAEHLYDGLLGLHMQRSKLGALMRLARLMTTVDSWFYLVGPKFLQRRLFHALASMGPLFRIPYPRAQRKTHTEEPAT